MKEINYFSPTKQQARTPGSLHVPVKDATVQDHPHDSYQLLISAGQSSMPQVFTQPLDGLQPLPADKQSTVCLHIGSNKVEEHGNVIGHCNKLQVPSRQSILHTCLLNTQPQDNGLHVMRNVSAPHTEEKPLAILKNPNINYTQPSKR